MSASIPDFDAAGIPEAESAVPPLSPADQAMVEKLARLSAAHHETSRSDNILETSESKQKAPRTTQKVQKATKSLDVGLDAVAADDGLMEDRRTAARKLNERLEKDPEFAEQYKAEQAALAVRKVYLPDEEDSESPIVDEDELEPNETSEPLIDKMEAMTLALERLGKACILIQNVGVMHVHIHK